MARIGAAWALVVTLGAGMGVAAAHAEHEHGAGAAQPSESVAANPQEQSLTGEVVDVFCYLTHGKEGLGKGHANCANKCIRSGLPVALKVGDRLYLATMASHEPANQALADLAGRQVSVRGKLMEQDGQHLIAITHIEPSD